MKRAEKKRSANPINPAGVPRGKSKTDVYDEMGRIEIVGLNYFEAQEVSCERPLSDRDEARLLIGRAEFLEYVAMRESDEEAASDRDLVVDGEGDVAFDEATISVIQHGFRPRSGGQRTAEELGAEQREIAEALEDLLWLKSERAQKKNSMKSPGVARAAAYESFRATFRREPREPPAWVGREAGRVLNKQRSDTVAHARRFRHQLANLPILDGKRQAITIADWRRNAGLPPKRPRRDAELPAPRSGFDARAFERRVEEARTAPSP